MATLSFFDLNEAFKKERLTKATKTKAFLIGAGAVQNAWNPIIRSLQPYYASEINSDNANCILARMIYLLRWYSLIPTDFAKEQFQKHLDFANTIKAEMCESLKSAQTSGELKIRKEFNSIVAKLLMPECKSFIIVSTNWDKVLDEAISEVPAIKNDPHFEWKNISILHLHGSYDNPLTMYLPTEVTKEPYRTEAEDTEIGTTHGNIMRALEDADEVIIYGLSFSPLDAELTQTIAAGMDNKKLKAVHVVDPQHSLIIPRVKVFSNYSDGIDMIGYSPDLLDRPIRYVT